MSALYVWVVSSREEDHVTVPIASLITFFTFTYCQSDVRLILVPAPLLTEPLYAVDLTGLCFERQENAALAQCCQLPAIVLQDGCTVVSGLCAVLRQLAPTLLGFRRSCLLAVAQVSLWTRFCEVDLPSLDPRHAARFEAHLAQPARVHNQRSEVDHTYAEGPKMTLSDVILFPCFCIIRRRLDLRRLPLTFAWFNRMSAQPGMTEAARIIREIPGKLIQRRDIPDEVMHFSEFSQEIIECSDMTTEWNDIPTVPAESLYKRDPKRYKAASRIFTRQEDVDSALLCFSASQLSTPWLEPGACLEKPLDWSRLPGPEVPASRLERKRSQLESMAQAVLGLARPGLVVADFCSGSGHLGLLLAALLPDCRVLLLENKAESQSRARARGTRLGLGNVTYIQSNLEYFTGAFDVGVALHACGVATDLVLELCVKRRASFVVCPCCYGNVQPTHSTRYPRSEMLRGRMELRDYLVLAHASDQTHGEDHEKTAQGNTCMAAIDADRCQAAAEAGYVVSLGRLHPTTCSPKNHLLVGQVQ